jgi:hypothetical protein
VASLNDTVRKTTRTYNVGNWIRSSSGLKKNYVRTRIVMFIRELRVDYIILKPSIYLDFGTTLFFLKLAIEAYFNLIISC